MSIRAMNWAWGIDGLTPTQKLTLMKLADHANDEGTCWPGKSSISAAVGASKRTIDAAIEHLEACRLIRVEKRKVKNSGNGKLNDTNLYFLNIEQPELFDGAKSALRQNLHQCNDGNEVVQSVQKGGATVAPESSVKPSIEPSINSAADAAGPEYRSKKGKVLKGDPLARFESVKSAFEDPRGKAEAADAWLEIETALLKRNIGLMPAILAGARQYAKDRTDLLEAGGTPKMLEGWLRGRRWEDYEQPADQVNGKPALQEQAPWFASWDGVKKRGYELGILESEYPENEAFAGEVVRRLDEQGEAVPSYLRAFSEGRG